MKIVGYETFIRMPAGTIFAPYDPCVFMEEPEIKVDPGHEYTDFRGDKKWSFNGTMPLTPAIDADAAVECKTGDRFDTEMCIYDGSSADYAEYKTFVIFEPNEIRSMINALHWALSGCVDTFKDFNAHHIPATYTSYRNLNSDHYLKEK